MNVQLISSTPEPLKVAFAAIRTCYSPSTYDDIANKEYEAYKTKNNDHLRLIKQIVSHGHTSTLEHVTMTFSIEDVSRALLAQLTRHRVGFSYSVQSQRYLRMDSDSRKGGFNYVIPKSIKGTEKESEYNELMDKIGEVYDKLFRFTKKAEDARAVLPNAALCSMVVTCNLRSFMDFYQKRNKETHAQDEIADLAEVMKKLVIEKMPWVEEIL